MPDPIFQIQDALAGRYSIKRELGKGGMATVYLARDVRHDRFVALKVMRPDLASSVGAERFLHEIRITAQLRHPHILPVFDSGEAGAGPSGGHLWYTMPYVEGETLRQRLVRQRTLQIDEAIRITCEIATALDYAHRRGIVHRDVKPENILIEEEPAVIADFGVARALDMAGAEGLTATGFAVGTPAYMSPEEAGGSSEVDVRADVYALGCVLYEMLAGGPPFAGTPKAVFSRSGARQAGSHCEGHGGGRLCQPELGEVTAGHRGESLTGRDGGNAGPDRRCREASREGDLRRGRADLR